MCCAANWTEKPKPMPKIYGLIRASTAGQKNSPEIQQYEIEEAIPKLEEALGAKYVRCFVDAGESAVSASKIPLLERDGVLDLKSVIRPHDVIVVARFDRLTRRVQDTAALLDWLKSSKLRFVDLSHGPAAFDPEGYTGMMITMAKTFAAVMESLTTGARVSERNRYLRARGRPINNRVPMGHRPVDDEGQPINWQRASLKTKQSAQFVLDADEVRHMAEASARWNRASGEPLMRILSDFNRRGLRTGGGTKYGWIAKKKKAPGWGANISRLRRGIEWYEQNREELESWLQDPE